MLYISKVERRGNHETKKQRNKETKKQILITLLVIMTFFLSSLLHSSESHHKKFQIEKAVWSYRVISPNNDGIQDKVKVSGLISYKCTWGIKPYIMGRSKNLKFKFLFKLKFLGENGYSSYLTKEVDLKPDYCVKSDGTMGAPDDRHCKVYYQSFSYGFDISELKLPDGFYQNDLEVELWKIVKVLNKHHFKQKNHVKKIIVASDYVQNEVYVWIPKKLYQVYTNTIFSGGVSVATDGNGNGVILVPLQLSNTVTQYVNDKYDVEFLLQDIGSADYGINFEHSSPDTESTFVSSQRLYYGWGSFFSTSREVTTPTLDSSFKVKIKVFYNGNYVDGLAEEFILWKEQENWRVMKKSAYEVWEREKRILNSITPDGKFDIYKMSARATEMNPEDVTAPTSYPWSEIGDVYADLEPYDNPFTPGTYSFEYTESVTKGVEDPIIEVKGRIFYYDVIEKSYKPLPHVLVNVFDKDGWHNEDDFICSTYTNLDGSFSCRGYARDLIDCPDPYVVVFAYSPAPIRAVGLSPKIKTSLSINNFVKLIKGETTIENLAKSAIEFKPLLSASTSERWGVCDSYDFGDIKIDSDANLWTAFIKAEELLNPIYKLARDIIVNVHTGKTLFDRFKEKPLEISGVGFGDMREETVLFTRVGSLYLFRPLCRLLENVSAIMYKDQGVKTSFCAPSKHLLVNDISTKEKFIIFAMMIGLYVREIAQTALIWREDPDNIASGLVEEVDLAQYEAEIDNILETTYRLIGSYVSVGNVPIPAAQAFITGFARYLAFSTIFYPTCEPIIPSFKSHDCGVGFISLDPNLPGFPGIEDPYFFYEIVTLNRFVKFYPGGMYRTEYVSAYLWDLSDISSENSRDKKPDDNGFYDAADDLFTSTRYTLRKMLTILTKDSEYSPYVINIKRFSNKIETNHCYYNNYLVPTAGLNGIELTPYSDCGGGGGGGGGGGCSSYSAPDSVLVILFSFLMLLIVKTFFYFKKRQ